MLTKCWDSAEMHSRPGREIAVSERGSESRGFRPWDGMRIALAAFHVVFFVARPPASAHFRPRDGLIRPWGGLHPGAEFPKGCACRAQAQLVGISPPGAVPARCRHSFWGFPAKQGSSLAALKFDSTHHRDPHDSKEYKTVMLYLPGFFI